MRHHVHVEARLRGCPRETLRLFPRALASTMRLPAAHCLKGDLMTSKRKRGNAYELRASCGFNARGKRIMKTRTWKPPYGMTEAQADSLLRADLRKLHKMCSRFGKDALLVATLAYNVGYYRLVGYGKIPKSRLIQKLESGNRDIYEEYISFRCYKGKVVPSIERRRKKEFELLYIH